MCRMCDKVPENIAYALADCSSLVLTEYMDRHNAAPKVMFFEMLRILKLADSVPPWYSWVELKPFYESEEFKHTVVFVFTQNALPSKPTGWVHDLWLDNRTKKDTKKTEKYCPLRWELIRQYQGYKIAQLNVIMNLLGVGPRS